MKPFWKDRSGSGIPLTVAAVLAVLILSCAVYEYLRLSIIASGVRDAVQSAIISVATENYSNVYPSLRQSYSGGYIRSSNGWMVKVSSGDIYTRLVATLGLAQEGNQYVKRTGGRSSTLYPIYRLRCKTLPLLLPQLRTPSNLLLRPLFIWRSHYLLVGDIYPL